MSAIAGILESNQTNQVQAMLQKMAHRGPAGSQVIPQSGLTVGAAWTHCEKAPVDQLVQSQFTFTERNDGSLLPRLQRDALGIAPLYYGWTNGGQTLCFASEVKALRDLTRQISILPPGCSFDGSQVQPWYQLKYGPLLQDSPGRVAEDLLARLSAAVQKHIDNGQVGAWLSGGLDSSAIAAIARSYAPELHTFAAGFAGAPDLEYARLAAAHIHSRHHEVTVSIRQALKVLPEVIYHLESFDALLVRSSITNYLVARLASDYVPAVFSGEGGDELFAGYDYLKSLDPALLPEELLDITGRLHNTALQRVDRSAAAHGILAYVPFLDTSVVELALSIPTTYKLHNGVEKWILRQTVESLLPPEIVNRPKAKFWEGAGVQKNIAAYAEDRISDRMFEQERSLPMGWVINSKEELFYYRIFREIFGEFTTLDWMGRTKGAPVS